MSREIDFEVATSIVCCPERGFLILRRSEHESRSGTWEFPGGRIEDGEGPEAAAVREAEEETGISPKVVDEGNPASLVEDSVHMVFHHYLLQADPEEEVELSREHDAYRWVPLEDLEGESDVVEWFGSLEEIGVEEVAGEVAVGAVEEDGEFLVLKRSENESSAGKWNFPSGKVEDGEEPREAAGRELQEETGLRGRAVEEGRSYIQKGELGLWKVHPFLMDAKGDVELNEEHDEFQWVEASELESLDTLGSLRVLEMLGYSEQF